MIDVYYNCICLYALPFAHKEYKLFGRAFFSLFCRPRTQLSAKKFEMACASEQSQFSCDSFLITDVKAFQPRERQMAHKLKNSSKVAHDKYEILFYIIPMLL